MSHTGLALGSKYLHLVPRLMKGFYKSSPKRCHKLPPSQTSKTESEGQKTTKSHHGRQDNNQQLQLDGGSRKDFKGFPVKTTVGSSRNKNPKEKIQT